MNKERILELADHLERLMDPATETEAGFSMSIWDSEGEDLRGQYPDHSGHDCGTLCCIAGWTERLWPEPDDYAGDILGLSRAMSYDLFEPRESYPDPYTSTPRRAAAVLRHLAATGEVDWSIPEPEVPS